MRRTCLLTHRLTLAVMALLAVWGLALAVFPIQPFWIDEWRLIFNLKFLSWAQLWGPLRYTQQCPRLYLAALKALNAPAQYSYATLRLPALALSVSSMAVAWQLMKRIFPDRQEWLRPLFMLILVSSQTFTTYLVQAKHYEAEIFLALTAMWQALELEKLAKEDMSVPRIVLLCFTLATAPFFSYTYPVAIAPALLLACYSVLNGGRKMILLPVAASAASICLFYLSDVCQLMHDTVMHRYWAYRMATGGPAQRLENLWYFFATVGPGAVFEIVFGLLGIAAVMYALLRLSGRVALVPGNPERWVTTYAISLILLVTLLSVSGRLPAGEAKFGAFCVPALALLIVSLLQWLRARARGVALVLGSILFAELAGNVVSVIYNTYTAPEYARRMRIYHATAAAIMQAKNLNLPLMVTPGVAWPDEIVHKVPFLENITADAVLKTWPAYDSRQRLRIHAIQDTACVPQGFRACIAGDGEHYRLLRQ